jgi:hypothetical protein
LGQNNNATLSMTGKASATNVQTFANTNIDIYGSVINVTNGTGGTATLNLGALTHTVGGTVVIPTNATNGTVRTTTSVATTNGILGGWAVAGTTDVQRGITQGSAFATVDGTGKIIPHMHGGPGLRSAQCQHADPQRSGDRGQRRQELKFTGLQRPPSAGRENAGTTTDINTLTYLPPANHMLIIERQHARPQVRRTTNRSTATTRCTSAEVLIHR